MKRERFGRSGEKIGGSGRASNQQRLFCALLNASKCGRQTTRVPVHGNETPSLSLRGECRWVKLIMPNLSWCPVAVALDDPGAVIAILEVDQRQAEFLDGLEAA